ncbi:hypothetical protein M3Y14_16685 [Bacillus thuringiensis]|nr:MULTISPECIES: hypothetical protein [Bacillus]UYX50212.1 hypothetical protein M3Y14_16685 [Bacillus thuringiensis]
MSFKERQKENVRIKIINAWYYTKIVKSRDENRNDFYPGFLI